MHLILTISTALKGFSSITTSFLNQESNMPTRSIMSDVWCIRHYQYTRKWEKIQLWHLSVFVTYLVWDFFSPHLGYQCWCGGVDFYLLSRWSWREHCPTRPTGLFRLPLLFSRSRVVLVPGAILLNFNSSPKAGFRRSAFKKQDPPWIRDESSSSVEISVK